MRPVTHEDDIKKKTPDPAKLGEITGKTQVLYSELGEIAGKTRVSPCGHANNVLPKLVSSSEDSSTIEDGLRKISLLSRIKHNHEWSYSQDKFGKIILAKHVKASL